MKEWFSIERIEQIINQYQELGPIVSFFLVFLESFLPFIPLIVVVVANANAYGFTEGFLYSWIGTSVGSYALFLIIRRFKKKAWLKKYIQRPQVQKMIRWVDQRGLTPILMLLCFPFTPSILVTIVAGLSNIQKKYYFLALLIGKFVMILTMTVVGHDLRTLLTNPIQLTMSIFVLILLWFLGKWIEKWLNQNIEKDLRNLRKKND